MYCVTASPISIIGALASCEGTVPLIESCIHGNKVTQTPSPPLVICLLPTEAEACLRSKHIHKITRVPPYAFECNVPYVFITFTEAPLRTPLSSLRGTNTSLPVSSPQLLHDFRPLFKVLHHSHPRCVPLPPYVCLTHILGTPSHLSPLLR